MYFRRILFLVLALAAAGWIALGLSASGEAFEQGVSENAQSFEGTSQDAANAGTTIGAGLGVTFFLCTGLPLLLLFTFLTWRAHVGIVNKRRHEEMIGAMKSQ